MDFYNKHYICTDADGHITAGWSDGPQPDRNIEEAILLCEDGGYQFRLCPGGEENPPLTDMDGVHLYRFEGGMVVETTAAEREAIRAALPATPTSDQPTMEQRTAALEGAVLALLGGESHA